MKKFAILTILVAGLTAQAGEVSLGTVILGSNRMDNKLMVAAPCPSLANPYVSAVKVNVFHNTAQIDDLIVTFKNGQTMPLNVREFFGANTSSRVIPVGGNRCINSLQVVGVGGVGTPTVVELVGFTSFVGSATCTARNARGWPFYGYGATVEGARFDAMSRCKAVSTYCHIVSCQ
jgi:hypothetical protein